MSPDTLMDALCNRDLIVLSSAAAIALALNPKLAWEDSNYGWGIRCESGNEK